MRDKSRERPGPSENQATHRAALIKKKKKKKKKKTLTKHLIPILVCLYIKQLHYELEILSRDS